MIRRPPISTQSRSSAASDVYKRQLLDRHGGLIDAEDTRGLARRRAQTPGELREVVRGVQPLDRLPPVAPPDEVVPLGNEVAERAAGVAERDAAVHAAPGLATDHLRIRRLVHLVPVHDPDRDGPTRRQLPLSHLEESPRVSHETPP